MATLLCKPRCDRTTVNKAKMTEYDLIQYYARQGRCKCGATKLRTKNYGFGWTDIPGAECRSCPLPETSLRKLEGDQRTLQLANEKLLSQVCSLTQLRAAQLVCSLFYKPMSSSKTQKILLLKNQAAAAAATAQSAQSNVGKQQKINDDLKEKLAALNEMAERRWREELKKRQDLNEKLAALDEAAELEAAAARAAAVSAAARAAAAATRASAKIAEEQKKNDDLKNKLSAALSANTRAHIDCATRTAKIQRLETAAAETKKMLEEATRIAKIYKNSWSYHFWPPS